MVVSDKVCFDLPSYGGPFNVVPVVVQAQMQLSTVELTNIAYAEPTVIAFANRKWEGILNAGGSAFTSFEGPDWQDLTDGSGHGVLIATDKVFLGVDTVGFPGAASFNFRMLYRWKAVSLTEYIGIVQSQQA